MAPVKHLKSDKLSDLIIQKIEQVWGESKAWPDFVEVMNRALHGDKAEVAQLNTKAFGLALLPGLCCQASGGDPLWADDLAAAWHLFYAGASLMDKVEDQDTFQEPWASRGPGVAVNAASGLFFTASLVLNNLYSHPDTQISAQAAIDCFQRHFLLMCSGQHRDLTQPEPTLKQYWEIAEAKSGAFFALACQAGARLATDDSQRLDDFNQFGVHLGVLIQVLDDLEDFQQAEDSVKELSAARISRSLPVIYALEVLPEPARDELRCLLKSASEDLANIPQVLHEIDQSGAVLYTLTEIERHRGLSLAFLEKAALEPEAKRDLTSLVEGLGRYLSGGLIVQFLIDQAH